MIYPKKIPNWIDGREVFFKRKSSQILKKNPTDGTELGYISSINKEEIDSVITVALKKFKILSNTSVVSRGELLKKTAMQMLLKKNEIAHIVRLETGKSMHDALLEVDGAIELGFFIAGEGRRFYGKTAPSAMPNRFAMTLRQPAGVAALIVPFNTPIANVAWKSFPALLCGNTVVLKASKDTPYTPIWFAKILKEAGVPSGIFNVIQGLGEEVGEALIHNRRVDLISFTGSTETGKHIQKVAADRLVKISLELGGKNALVVCDDCDINAAVEWSILSAFSNAGQRCAAGSRIIVFEKVYEVFKKIFIKKTEELKIGSSDTDDLGPVINGNQLSKMINILTKAKNDGISVLTGGFRIQDKKYRGGFFLAPTILENALPDSEISTCELFGPITSLYKVKNFNQALDMTNNSPFGLTAAIHTKNINRVQEFINHAEVGVVSVNGPTYGSEPHMPFGGLKQSGTGWREPRVEALNFYSQWKTIYVKHNP